MFTDTCMGITVTGKHIAFKALENFKVEFVETDMRNILHAIHHDYQVVTLEKEWG